MGINHSNIFQRTDVVIPKNIKLKFTKLEKYNKIIYIYFTPNKKLSHNFIKLEIKRKNKDLEVYNIHIDKNKINYTIIDNKDYLEYTHKIDDIRKIIVRTNHTYHIQSIVLVVPYDYLL